MKTSHQFLLIFLLSISTLVSISSTNLSKSYALSYLEYSSYIVLTKDLKVRSSPHIEKNNIIKKVYKDNIIQGVEIESKDVKGHKEKWIQTKNGNFIFAKHVKLHVKNKKIAEKSFAQIDNVDLSPKQSTTKSVSQATTSTSQTFSPSGIKNSQNPNAEGEGAGILLITSAISILGFSLYRHDKKSKEVSRVETERLNKIEEEKRIANQIIYIVVPVCHVKDISWIFYKKYSIKIGYFYESFKGGILQEVENTRYPLIFEKSEIDEQKLIELARTTVKACMSEITQEISQSFVGELSSSISPMLMSSLEPSIKTVDVQYQRSSG